MRVVTSLLEEELFQGTPRVRLNEANASLLTNAPITNVMVPYPNN